MNATTEQWSMPVSWENLSRTELEHAVREGYATGVGQIVEMIYAAGQMAAYYAWGRLDQGHPQVCPYRDAHGFHRTKSDDVQAFKILFERARRDMFAGLIVSNPSVQDAWDEYVRSHGTAIR